MAFSLERWKGKTAIVTGASAGIGAAIVEKLVEAGVNVAGFARRKERVDELAQKLKSHPGQVHSVKVDITNENEILEGFKWVKQNLGPIHILVNNAGIAQPTSLIDGDSEMWKKVFDTNVFGLCVATREAVKDMRANNVDGHIIHINSIAGHQAIPFFNVYSGSKFAVRALAETLRYELAAANTKIKITNISLGLVATEIFEANQLTFPVVIKNTNTQTNKFLLIFNNRSQLWNVNFTPSALIRQCSPFLILPVWHRRTTVLLLMQHG